MKAKKSNCTEMSNSRYLKLKACVWRYHELIEAKRNYSELTVILNEQVLMVT